MRCDIKIRCALSTMHDYTVLGIFVGSNKKVPYALSTIKIKWKRNEIDAKH